MYEQMLDKYTPLHIQIHPQFDINKCLTITIFVNKLNMCYRIPEKSIYGV